MKNKTKRYFWGWMVSVLLTCCVVLPAYSETFSLTPKTNNGKKWRIGYHEGGEYTDYQKMLIAIIKGLMDLGWLEPAEIPPQTGEQTTELWHWLATNVRSEYLEFVQDAHYTANWGDDRRKTMTDEIIRRLNTQQDLDFMIAAGTWAGQNLANDRHHTPTMVISTSNAVAAGIIKSIEDSGYDHVLARVNPYHHKRQVQIFHDVIGFHRLGLAYEDSPAGRTYAALEHVKEVAKARGFAIISCYTYDDHPDKDLCAESLKTCFRELGEKQVDAIYVTAQSGVSTKSIPELVAIANSYRIPTFVQSNADNVQYGFLMSVTPPDYDHTGRFYARTMAQHFNGAKLRQLEQIFEPPLNIAINMETARVIGFTPPLDVVEEADIIYDQIITPPAE